MDLDCGITNKHLRVSLFIKIITGIFSLATLIYMFVLNKCLYEYIWRKPIHNGNIAATATSFLLLTIIVTIVLHLKCIHYIPFIGTNKLYQVFIATAFGVFTLLFAFIFGIKNISSSYKDELCNSEYGRFYIYWEQNHKDDYEYNQWKQTHPGSKATKYFSNRTTTAGSTVLGLFITLTCLFSALLFYFYHENDPERFSDDLIDSIESYLIEKNPIRAVFVGDSGTGKTNIITKFVNNSFDENSPQTKGSSFYSKTIQINRKNSSVQLWDTTGQEHYKSLNKIFYEEAKIAYFVFDLTSRSSFENINGWLNEVDVNKSSNFVKVLIGNKCDLPSSDWQVSKEEIESFAKSNNMEYFEVSAKNGTNINEAITSGFSNLNTNAIYN